MQYDSVPAVTPPSNFDQAELHRDSVVNQTDLAEWWNEYGTNGTATKENDESNNHGNVGGIDFL